MTKRHEISVPDGTLAADESGSGTPVMLLHAGVGDSRMWDPVVERLRDRYRLLRYDARGYGRTPAPTAPFSMLGDLLAVLDYFGLDRVHLVGCSMGGQISMDCAIAHPDRVRTLTLLAPGLSGYEWPDDPHDERLMQAVADQDLDYLTDFMLKTWAQGQGTDPRTDAIVVEQAKSATKAWLTEEFEEGEPSAVDQLGAITQPTVLLIGDRDFPPIEDIAALVVARIPGARRVDAPGVDHFVPLRVPDLVSELIVEQVERAS